MDTISLTKMNKEAPALVEQQEIPLLPLSLIVRVLSYNIQTTSDVARLRFLGRDAVSMVPSFMKKSVLRVPTNCVKKREHFITEFVSADKGWHERYGFTPFEERTFENTAEIDPITGWRQAIVEAFRPFLRDAKPKSFPSGVVKVIFLDHSSPRNKEEKEVARPTTGKRQQHSKAGMDEELIKCHEFRDVLELIPRATSKDVPTLHVALECNRLHCVSQYCMAFDSWLVYLVVEIPSTASFIQKKIETAEGETFLHLQSDPTNRRCYTELPAEAGLVYRGRVIQTAKRKDGHYHTVELVMDFKLRSRAVLMGRCTGQRKPVFDNVMTRHLTRTSMVEGIAIVDDGIHQELATAISNQIDECLVKKQEKENRVAYRPHSNCVIRDLVHPGLYPYVKGITPLIATAGEVRPGVDNQKEDFWGRCYKDSTYQWIPTDFSVSDDGTCTILDYINNLVPREDYKELYASLEVLFSKALPYMESVYSYVRAVRRLIRPRGAMELPVRDLIPLSWEPFTLRGQKLQVTTKIADYALKPGQEYEGDWHVEGMSHEEIVLTCLFILDRDSSLEGGSLQFKRTILRGEASHLETMTSMHRTSGEKLNDDGLIPLGQVETPKGRFIVFPNSHVHRLCPIRNADSIDLSKVGKRRIVVFFLVNPLQRILSTHEVAPQQEYAGGEMTWEDAKKHRSEMRKERKHTKQDWNIERVNSIGFHNYGRLSRED